MPTFRDVIEHLRSDWKAVPRAQMLAVVIGTAVLAWRILVDEDGFLMLLDSANLAFHEAGHPIYGILGGTMALYGGTLGQLTFPLVVMVQGVWRRTPVMTSVALIWLGQNFINIARYMADARAQELPLVGGGEHDWFNIFTRWHVLQRDLQIAHVTGGLGWTLIAAGVAFVIWRWKELSEVPQPTGVS